MKATLLAYIRGHQLELQNFHTSNIIEETKTYFRTGLFNKDVVDFLLSLAPKALQVNVHIYERNTAGMTHHIPFIISDTYPTVHLKYTHNIESPMANHYDPIITLPQHDNTVEEEITYAGKKEYIGFADHSPLDMENELSTTDVDSSDISYIGNSSSSSNNITSTDDDMSFGWQGEGNDEEVKFLQQYKFPMAAFRDVEPEWVDYLPTDINGKHIYKMKSTAKSWHGAASDRRHFQMNTSRRKNLRGTRKVGICAGNIFCPNERCTFKSTNGGTINEAHYQNIDGSKACFSCGMFMAGTICGARKLTEWDESTKVLTVYHIGTHTCRLKIDTKRHLKEIRNAVRKYKHVGPVEAKRLEVGEATNRGDIEEARRRARNLNWKRFRIEKGLQYREQNPERQSFDAVAAYKENTDKSDKYLIYMINERNRNGDPDLVFKCSLEMAKILLDMDQDGPENALQLEECYFDGAHKRCFGFKTLGLFVYHPGMRRLLRIASMEVRSETTENVHWFWKILNKVLSEVNGKPTQFNPKAIMVDEAQANYTGVEQVFGWDFRREKVISCQQHYKSNVNLVARQISYTYQHAFKDICFRMCNCATVAEYNTLKSDLDKYVAMFPNIRHWVDWWDARKYHVFPAFRRFGYSRVTLAESGHAMSRRTNQLWLLDAARDDTNSMVIQVEDLKAFLEQTSSSSGTGPNLIARATDDRREQLRVAREYGREFLDREAMLQCREAEAEMMATAFQPSVSGRHRPTKRKGLDGTTVTGAGKKKGKPRRKKACPQATVGVIANNLSMAKEIMSNDEVLQEPPTAEEDNKPHLELFMGRNISRCQGCPKPIKKNECPPPRDFVLRTRGLRIWKDGITQQLRSEEGNLYFHMSMDCLRKKYQNKYALDDVVMEADTFALLTAGHFCYLKEKGFLDIIIKQFESSN